jgi:antibiotic biosynthesis monooxygenase (ABM) superfamily enzyme
MEYNNVSEAKKRIATNIISEIVKPGSQQDFETWSKRINKVVAQQSGFISSDILRPRDKNHLEYIIIIRFETYDTLNDWKTSETFKTIFKEVKPHLVSHQSQQQSHGIEQWFELPEHEIHQAKKPAFYKLVVMGIIAVYPLVLLSNLALAPITHNLPYWLVVLLSVVFISVLMTWPVMPLISKILSPWLYPKPKALF